MIQTKPCFLHLDLDAFFASVEQLDHPEYRGKPVIVGGLPEDRRSVVSTASYEARVFGIHSAMPTFQAYKLCPHGIFVRGRMKRYAELSYKIMSIFKDYSPDVLQMSIDEAFIDLTGTEHLFGPPEETALKIKKRVKEETGLTISVGLASTKYLAKIASDMSKPDGFYQIKAGDEERFMLNLPLKKVWGIGTKTLEALNNAGLKTTRDIHEKSLEILKFMYGNNQGQFLYDVVRGLEKNTFDAPPKAHSISTEKTFSYDLTDIYTIETNILEMCHGLMFRLLKEGGFSKTVMVKIRYEDFSTVTIQHTDEKNILTIDSLYNAAKNLFEQKFERGRGLRLLGIAFENITTEEKPFQQELFDDGSEKKQKVEKAILSLQKKHPEISVHKARLLNPQKTKSLIPIFLFLALSIFLPEKAFTQQLNNVSQDGAAAILPQEAEKNENKKFLTSLFNLNLPLDSFLEAYASGFWKTSFLFSVNSSFGEGNPLTLSASVPVFSQSLDLTLFLRINENWYFDFDFLDDYSKNTYTFGYDGKNNLEHFEFSNRNISFPDYYSAKNLGFGLSGGQALSPGVILNFNDYKNQHWKSTFLFRYDMTKSHNATFYGYNSVVDNKISLENYLSTKKFVLPASKNLAAIKNVYIEYKDGEFTDKNGRSYVRLSTSDYLILPEKKLLLLSNSYKQTGSLQSVLVTFSNESDFLECVENLGSYSNANSFLGEIQEYFAKTKNNIKLEDYSYNFINFIEGTSALEIQSPSGFSPFICADTYDCGIIDTADVGICTNSEESSKKYYASLEDEEYALLNEDFFLEKHKYAVIRNADSDYDDYTKPELRFPISGSPEIYLTKASSSALYLRLRTYSKVSGFNIGRDASKDTVQMYINDILDNTAEYDSETGYVTTKRTVQATDKIYIIWEEQSDWAQNGSISAGAGFLYQLTPKSDFNISLTTKWPLVISEAYADSDETMYGFAALSSGINLKKDNFSINEELAFYIKNENVSGNLLADTISQNGFTTYYHSSSAAFSVKNAIELNGTELSLDSNFTDSNLKGVNDSSISGYALPLKWNFSDSAEGKNVWAAANIQLHNGSLLKNSDSFTLALKSDSIKNGLELWLELGVKAGASFSGEDAASIPTWNITDSLYDGVLSSFDTENSSWQTVKIEIPEEIRAKLTENYDLRLIVVKENYKLEDNIASGVLYIGPYETGVLPCSIYAENPVKIHNEVIQTNSPSAKEFISSKNYSAEIEWNIIDQTEISDKNDTITMVRYFEKSSFYPYSNICLDFKLNEEIILENEEKPEEGLVFILDAQSDSSYSEGNEALYLMLSSKAINPFIGDEWNTLNINTNSNEVFINGNKIEKTEFTLRINKTVVPDRRKIILKTQQYKRLIKKGSFVLDNLYYQNTQMNAGIKNQIAAEWKKDGTVLKIKEYDFLKDVSVQVNSSQDVIFVSAQNKKNNTAISATEQTGFTLAGINFAQDLSTNFNSDNQDNNIISNAGHSISTEKAILQFFKFSESYRYSTASNQISGNKADKFDFIFPYTSISFSSTSTNNYLNSNQDASLLVNLQLPEKLFNFSYATDFFAKQKLEEGTASWDSNYFYSWLESSKLQFSTGEKNATTRNSGLNAKTQFSLPFANLKPEIQFKLNSTYKNTKAHTIQDSAEFIFTIPFSISKNNFSAVYTKKSEGSHSDPTSTDYFDDFTQMTQFQKDKSWFYSQCPFADLFSTKLSSNVLASPDDSAFYSGNYSLQWNRTIFNKLKDFFIPISATLGISRDIRSGENSADNLQIKAVVSHSSVNLFGAKGIKKLFKWYNTDEFNSSFSYAVKIPQNTTSEASPIFQLSFYNSALFYITQTDNVKAGTDFMLSSNSDWQSRGTFVWSRKTASLPIEFLISKFYPQFSEFEKFCTRKESLNISFSSTTGVFSNTINYMHNAEMKILSHYTIGTGIGGTIQHTQNKALTLSLDFSLNAKVEF